MTVRKSAAVNAGIMPDYAMAGVELVRTMNWTTDVQINCTDTFQMLPIPKDAILLDFAIMASLGTGATNADVGWGTVITGIMDDIALTGYSLKRLNANTDQNPSSGWLHKFTADDTIDLVINKIASKVVTSTKIKAAVWYKMAGTIEDET